MTRRLEQNLIQGELNNLSRNSVKGKLYLRGARHPVILTLTGNAGEPFLGRWLRFTPRKADKAGEADAAPGSTATLATEAAAGLAGVSPQQIGPVVEITQGRDQAFRMKWFGPEGEILVELADPLIEFLDETPAGASDGDNEFHDGETVDDEQSRGGEGQRGQGKAFDGDDELFDDEETVAWEAPPEMNPSSDVASSPPLDRYHAQLAQWKPDEETLRQWDLMDEVFEGRNEVPLRSFFEEQWPLPLDTQLSDEQIDRCVIELLAVLARQNIAVELCEHFTPRAVYRMLVDNIIAEEWTHPRQRETGVITHYTGWSHCQSCNAEMHECCPD